jgi:hypothetical protein
VSDVIDNKYKNNPAQWEQDCFNPTSENVKKCLDLKKTVEANFVRLYM